MASVWLLGNESGGRVHVIGRILAVAAIACSGTALAAVSEARQPTGKWIVDFDDAQCVATRNYGSDEDPLWLAIKAPPIGDVLQVAIIRNGQVDGANQVDGEILFDESPPIRTTLLEFDVEKLGQRVLSVNLPSRELAQRRTASRLQIRAREAGVQVLGSRVPVGKRHADEQFALSQLEPLLKVLDECAADLRQVWNVDPQDGPTSKLKERASGDLAEIFRGGDYPGQAFLKNMEGAVRMALLIDETGGVADCTVIETSGIAILDAQSCSVVVKRARFKPAIGHDGKPAKDGIVQRVRWGLR